MLSRIASRALFGLFFLVPFVLVPGCGSDTPTQPSAVDDSGAASFDGTVDPGAGEFVLQRIIVPDPDQRPITVELIGSNLRTDETEQTVSLDVAVRNAWTQSLHRPLEIHVSGFDPASVGLLNADDAHIPIIEDAAAVIYVFDYGELLPDEGLAPGATSESKLWIFHDPGLVAFSFAARAIAGLVPAGPVIGGRLFLDANRNGHFDAGEEPFRAGYVQITGPEGFHGGAMAGPDGRYAVPVELPGIYSVRLESLLESPFEPCYTTPNPLQVLLTPSDGDQVPSFLDADFGLLLGPCPAEPVVRLSHDPPDSIPNNRYDLDRIELRGDVLHMRVGFSGCSPDHPFALWAGLDFMESNPVQTWVRLEHDDLGEACAAYWVRDLEFDLGPLRRAYIDRYGQPGVIILVFRDHFGVEHRFEFGP